MKLFAFVIGFTDKRLWIIVAALALDLVEFDFHESIITRSVYV
jgi:hypothetical protein